VLSSHFSIGAAPQVGQDTASICFGLSSTFMAKIMPQTQVGECSIRNTGSLVQGLSFLKRPEHQPPAAAIGKLVAKL
jgi:hypothetical protein